MVVKDEERHVGCPLVGGAPPPSPPCRRSTEPNHEERHASAYNLRRPMRRPDRETRHESDDHVREVYWRKSVQELVLEVDIERHPRTHASTLGSDGATENPGC